MSRKTRVPSSWVMWEAFSTVICHLMCSGTANCCCYYYYCCCCVNLPDNLIWLTFAFNPGYIWKLKPRKVKKFARITQLISSRAKIQIQVCVAPELIFFPVPPAQIATCLCQFSGAGGPRPVPLSWGCRWRLDMPVLCACNHLAPPALLPNGSCAPGSSPSL